MRVTQVLEQKLDDIVEEFSTVYQAGAFCRAAELSMDAVAALEALPEVGGPQIIKKRARMSCTAPPVEYCILYYNMGVSLHQLGYFVAARSLYAHASQAPACLHVIYNLPRMHAHV